MKWMKHITKAGVEPTNDEADDQRNQEYGKGIIAAELGANKPPINVNVEVDIKLEEAHMRGIPCKAPPVKAPPTDPKHWYKAPPGYPQQRLRDLRQGTCVLGETHLRKKMT